jgi:hypothetical protein
MAQKFYTPTGARQALRFVRPAAERIRRLYRRLERRQPLQIVPEERVEPVYFSVLSDLQTVVDRLAEEGVQVKDPEQGLVDFPARRAGRTVWLCWKVGESSVSHWHEVDAGFAGRRTIDEDGPWETIGEEAETAG